MEQGKPRIVFPGKNRMGFPGKAQLLKSLKIAGAAVLAIAIAGELHLKYSEYEKGNLEKRTQSGAGIFVCPAAFCR